MNWNEKAEHQVRGWTQIQKIGIRQALELICGPNSADVPQSLKTRVLIRIEHLQKLLNKTDEEER